MPVSRMRMRPWLEMMIESNTVPGLCWEDKEKTMFSIPWKHAARHGWEMDKDASLFKRWALHTGKYVEGQTCDPKTWKANFRCALNSLPDIKEVKNRSVNKGHQAMRIFKMLPATPKSSDKRRKLKEQKLRKKTSAIKMEEDTDYSDSQSPSSSSLSEEATQESTVDSTLLIEQEELLYPLSDVPTEIVDDGPVSFNSFSDRFQVSPDHFTEEVIEICQQLEKDLQWDLSSNEGMGFLHSPRSQWSESSSADELEFPQYTTLSSNVINPTDYFWQGLHDQRAPLF